MNIFEGIQLSSVLNDPWLLLGMLGLSTVLGLVIALVYRFTHRGFSYSQSFAISSLLITVITTLIIVLIEDSIARAIGIFGAFSIIRFRTAVKDVRDIAFIFFALAIGLAVGIRAAQAAIVGCLFISALIFVLHKMNFGGLRRLDYVLNFRMNAKDHSADAFKSVMDKHLKKQVLLNVEAKERGSYLVYTFNVALGKKDGLDDFVKTMNKVEGVSDVSMVSSKGVVEY